MVRGSRVSVQPICRPASHTSSGTLPSPMSAHSLLFSLTLAVVFVHTDQPSQEPALWAFVGPAVVTRFGAVLSNGVHVVLDPEHHGVCHRMRAPDDISPRSMPAGGDAGASHGIGWVRELYVISQPWGHTVFHFIAECLPKVPLFLVTSALGWFP